MQKLYNYVPEPPVKSEFPRLEKKKHVFPLERICQAVLLHCSKDLLQGNCLQRVNSRHNILLMLSKERCLFCWSIS